MCGWMDGWCIYSTCESLRVDVHPFNNLSRFSNSQGKIHFIGTVSLGSTVVAIKPTFNRSKCIKKDLHII